MDAWVRDGARDGSDRCQVWWTRGRWRCKYVRQAQRLDTQTDRETERERGLRLFGDGLFVCQSLSDACLLEEEETGSDWLRLVGLK
jgi:hypothetical protein